MEIIGVAHSGNHVKEAVINHIDDQYPDLESIMLELPPGYGEIEEARGYKDFFGDIAEYYKEKGVRVISGDRKKLSTVGMSLNEVLAKLKENSKKTYLLEGLYDLLGIFNGRVTRDRNQDMGELFKEQKPEVSVLGGAHGAYLKEHNPDACFSVFANDSLTTRLMHRLVTFKKSRKPDATYFISDPYDPTKKQQYAQNFQLCLGGGATALAWGAITYLGLDSAAALFTSTSLTTAGLYLMGSNLKRATYYIKSTRETSR